MSTPLTFHIHVHYLSHVVSGDAAHVIMYGRYNRNGVSSHIHARKDHGGLRDTRQTCLKSLSWQM